MVEKKQEKKYKKKKSKAAETQKSEKIPSGWNTTDEDEIRRRCLRAEVEPMKVANFNSSFPYDAGTVGAIALTLFSVRGWGIGIRRSH